MNERSRRQFLRGIGTLSSAAAVAVLAGCTGSEPDPGPATGDTSRSDTPANQPTPTRSPAGSPTARPGMDGPPVPPLSGSWSSARHDGRNTGTTPDSGPTDRPDGLWQYAPASGDPATAPATADGAFVVVSRSGALSAVDASAGTVRWTRTRPVGTVVAPAASDGTVVAADGRGLVGLSVGDGTQQWTATLDGRVEGLAAGGGLAVAATGGALVARSLADGSEEWRRPLSEAPSTPPAIGAGTVAVGLESGDIVAVAAGSGDRRWRESVGEIHLRPTVAHGRVVVASDRGVHAFDAASGGESWERSTNAIYAPPVATGDGVYVATVRREDDPATPENGTPLPTDVVDIDYHVDLVALAPDGTERWRAEKYYHVSNFTEPRPRPTVAASDDAVVLASLEDLRAYDPADGDLIWSGTAGSVSPAVAEGVVWSGGPAYDATGGSVRWSGGDERAGIASTPAVVGNEAYVGTEAGSVLALAANAGELSWRAEVDGAVRTTPAVDEERVYVGDASGTLFALDRADGRERWTFDVGNNAATAPSLGDGAVYVGDENGRLHAVETDTGEGRWQVDFAPEDSLAGFYGGAPAVADGTVYAGANGQLRALATADGSERWRVDFESEGEDRPGLAQATPVVTDERVFVNAALTVHAVDRATGDRLWSHDGGGASSAELAVREGIVYVPRASSVVARDAASGDLVWSTPVGHADWVVASEETVYAGARGRPDAGVVALDPDGGDRLWRSDVRHAAHPAVAGEYLLVGDDAGRVLALGPAPE